MIGCRFRDLPAHQAEGAEGAQGQDMAAPKKRLKHSVRCACATCCEWNRLIVTKPGAKIEIAAELAPLERVGSAAGFEFIRLSRSVH